MKPWVIIPAYQEGNTIATVVNGVLPYAEQVIVVDDGSSDITSIAAKTAGAQVIRHVVNCGYGAALTTGTDYALRHGAKIIIHFDADDQFVPGEIPNLVKSLILDKPSAVLGSRFLGQAIGLPWLRRITLKLGIVFTWLVSGVWLSDTHNGFRAFTCEAMRLMRFKQPGMAYSSEVIDELARGHILFCEVPVTIKYTKASIKGSKQGTLPALKIACDFLIGKLLR